ncbi:MAG: preprotein translocase subunit YajC [Actinobacteria bacterium]|nr:preprotein translocase subunit YajC [Actinomycetota bacterium]MBV8480035.1 preprotein translocase subunit YajC [Actinomycetota bacterium]MBV8599891.1 preprotein translocase subunit YajC [Actinomycetota bacterium]
MSAGFLIIIVAFAFLYFVLIRPQKRRQLQSQRMLDEIKVGAEVVTAGGIYGTVTELDAEWILVEIAPQLTVKVARRAIGTVIPPEIEEAEEPHEQEPPAVENGG